MSLLMSAYVNTIFRDIAEYLITIMVESIISNQLDLLQDIAISHARSGADLNAPSSMMDGQVESIRQALDSCGFGVVKIMSYSAKHASSLYGPFRSVAFSRVNLTIWRLANQRINCHILTEGKPSEKLNRISAKALTW